MALPLLCLTACTTFLPEQLRSNLSSIESHQVDFGELDYYALRSKAAYASAGKIKSGFPNTIRINAIRSSDVAYFIETDSKNATQTISIRGTANKPNVFQDVEVALVKDSILGIALHRGFQQDARSIYPDLKKYVRKDHNIRVTGHSLGGAVAAIIAGYLQQEGYDVTRVVTFGQPKYTTNKRSLLGSRLTRVVHHQDVVPMVPPTGLVVHYVHHGPEIVLLPGPDYVYLNAHVADRLSVDQFWRNLGHLSGNDHHIDQYVGNIEAKRKGNPKQVPYRPSG